MKERKTYYSFHDVPFESNYGYSTVNSELGMRFSKNELIQILISMGALTIAFTFALARSSDLAFFNAIIFYLPISFLAIATAFLCHELAHKYVGIKYGYWSEFRMFTQGLLIALFLGIFVGVVFAAPGAVQIYGNPTREESGKMAAAGPFTNLAISAIFYLLSQSFTGYLALVFSFIAYINAFLAIFNLIPFGPLDGMKIFRWRIEVWIILLLGGISLFILLWI
jgi:Zn-dependent protease